jgi:CMP-N,N'-diacetyllegionaminic acid synthase
MVPSAVALIPARSGSKRVPHKNIRALGGHPMLAYSIRAAIDSGVFTAVICATDSPRYADIARYYGADVPFLRSADISGDTSPDIEWVLWMLDRLGAEGRRYDAFSILRPTSPFRRAETIRHAWEAFHTDPSADSLRAVEPCVQHPGKMWVIRGERLLPLLPFDTAGTPWHSTPYSALPPVFAQNASLELAWTKMAVASRTIAGVAIRPFISEGLDGFDINNPEDMVLAQHYLDQDPGRLPSIALAPYPLTDEEK